MYDRTPDGEGMLTNMLKTSKTILVIVYKVQEFPKLNNFRVLAAQLSISHNIMAKTSMNHRVTIKLKLEMGRGRGVLKLIYRTDPLFLVVQRGNQRYKLCIEFRIFFKPSFVTE